jgi:DNA-binding NtrC family response regulator
MSKTAVLLVDDEPGARFAIKDYLEAKGFAVDEAEDCATSIDLFHKTHHDLAIVDYRLPDGTALDILARLHALDDTVPVLVLTGHGTIDLAVQAIKDGAEQFLTKPVELRSLLTLVKRSVENRRNRKGQRAKKLRAQRGVVDPFADGSAAIRDLESDARRMVRSESPVLITGETGCGKGVLAHWLHTHGPRADEPFVDINCAGLSMELLDSELFGHERGAFTSAVEEKTGLLEMAHRGTLFLDEIGDMDLRVQAKFLKVIEEQRFRRLGGVRDLRVDIRLIAATNRNLSQQVRDGNVRQDLYFRINTIELAMPPLRQRVEGIAELARLLLKKLTGDLGRGEVHLSPDAEQALVRYAWPGNVRELRNVLERALLRSDGSKLGRRDMRFEVPAESEFQLSSGLTLRELEVRHIECTMREVQGRIAVAAERLGVPKSSLYQKLKTYQIDPSRFRSAYPETG